MSALTAGPRFWSSFFQSDLISACQQLFVFVRVLALGRSLPFQQISSRAAQLGSRLVAIEQQISTPWVAGSNPAGIAIISDDQ
jgi:hypothetical protein